jgi:RNA polymerase sigma factor (sigma-70 family)
MAKTLDLFIHRLRMLVDPARREKATDGELLARWALNRDGRAFAALVGRHGALVWRVGRSILGQREDAEDTFQATFLVLARKAVSLQRRSSIGGWLYQTAYRLACKSRAATARRLRREDRAEQKTVIDPLEEISVREARTILTQELDRLSAAYREPLLLCLYEGATQDEAARRLGCPLRTLKRRLERGRVLLARRLSRRGLAPASALALTLCSRAEVPAGLATKTITAATLFASGEVISGSAAVLAEGVLRGLMFKTLAAYGTLFLVLGSLTLAVDFAYLPAAATQVPKKQRLGEPEAFAKTKASFTNASGWDEAPRLDPNGDPLPPGAIQRIGSARLRHGGDSGLVLYTPDGATLVSTSRDGDLHFWNAATGKLRWRFPMNQEPSYRQVAVSRDGTKVAVLSGSAYTVVESKSGEKLIRHEWPRAIEDDFAWCLAIAPDLGMFARGCHDGTVRLYDGATGEEKLRVVAGDKALGQIPRTIEFSADGTMISVLRRPAEFMVFDTKTAKPIKTLEIPKGLANPDKLVFSHNHGRLAVLDGRPDFARVIIWDVATGKHEHIIENPLDAYICGAFSPDDGLLALGGGGTDIVILDATTGKELRRLHSRQGTDSLDFSPDGKTLVSDANGCLSLWDVATGKPKAPLREPSGLRSMHFANSARELVFIGDGAEWWDIARAKRVRHVLLDPKSYDLYGVQTVSADGKLLAAASKTSDLTADLELIDAATGKILHTLMRQKFLMATSTFSPDGTKFFTAGWSDPHVIIWDVATGKPLHDLQSHSRFVNKLAVSPDGHLLASAGSEVNAQGDYDIRLWEVASGKLIHRLTPRRGSAFSMVFSADSSQLVSGGGDPGRLNTSGEVQLWDVATGKEVRAFIGHEERVTCVAISGDSRMIATGSIDRTLRLWEVASGMERNRILGHQMRVIGVDFAPGGRLLAAASQDAPVFIWDAYVIQKPKSAGAKLAKEDREKLWQRLADPDATVGYQAVCELIAHPAEASTILEGGWKQLPRATSKQMRGWVDDLSSDQFSVRKTATAELERFAAAHEDVLREGLNLAGSLEARQRLEKILGRLDPERLRRSRMLEVLEQLHTTPARQFLQILAEQNEDAFMAREAAAGLKRLDLHK